LRSLTVSESGLASARRGDASPENFFRRDDDLRSRTRDCVPGITRECVTGGAGTRPYPKHLFRRVADMRSGVVFSIWGDIMSNPLYRAQRCRDLAQECRAIAALCAPSTEMQAHYSRMSEHYSSLAEAEEPGMLA